MKLRFLAVLALGILLIISLVLVRFSYKTHSVVISLPAEGSYQLVARGTDTMSYSGIVQFKNKSYISPKGITHRILELGLVHGEKEEAEFISFIISSDPGVDSFRKGIYKITNNIDGFLSDFEGVFGFANIEQEGELPFFASEGTLQLYDIEEERITGGINATFSNSLGETIAIEGHFVALEKNTGNQLAYSR